MLRQPTFVEARAEDVSVNGFGQLQFPCVHPQWGGYVGLCIVTFDKVTGCSGDGVGCFDVLNFHDGDFPVSESNENDPTNLHYCDPGQVIEFGITVLEKILEHQSARDGTGLRVSVEEIEGFVKRLSAIVDAVEAGP